MFFFLILTVYSLPLLIIHTFIMFYHSALLVTLRHSPPSYSQLYRSFVSSVVYDYCKHALMQSSRNWKCLYAVTTSLGNFAWAKGNMHYPRLKYVVDDVTAGQWLATTVCWIHICLLSSPARGSEDTYARPVWWVAYRQSVSSTLHVHLW